MKIGRKVADFLLHTFYIMFLVLLSLFIFWKVYAEEYIKIYIETHIHDTYGQYIIRTYKDCELIKNYDLPVKDDNGESREIGN